MTRIGNDKIDFEETNERPTPSSGEASVYVKQDKQVYKKSDDGEEIRLSIADYNDLENRSHGNEDHDVDFLVQQDVEDFRNYSSYQPGMVSWQNELNYEEVQRIELQQGQKMVVDRVEMRQKGGGSSNSSASLRVNDITEGSVIHEEDLNSVSSEVGESSEGSVVLFELYNFTGGSIKASPCIDYRIV